MINSQKYIIQNMERIEFFDLVDGSCVFSVDDLQSAEMVNEQETVYATGKNGAKIGSADRNKASRITAVNGSIVDGVLGVQTGTEVQTGTFEAPWTETAVTADGATLTTEKKAVGVTGNEIGWVYKRNLDGTLGEKYPQAAAASTTAFAYDPATKELTLPTGAFATGEEAVLFYNVSVPGAKKITNAENKFSGTGKLVAHIFAKDICTEKSYYGVIIYPKAKASGSFNLSFGNDPSVQNMEFEALSGGCGGAANRNFWDLIIFDDDDAQ